MSDRRIDYLPLAELQSAERNPKRHDTAALAASIGRHGLAEVPMLDDRTGRLVAGHGRVADIAARHAAGDVAPKGIHFANDGTWLVPVLRGWASGSDTEAESYLLGSNKITMSGGWDDPGLATMLAELAIADYDLATVAGFSAAELDDLTRLATDPTPAIVHDLPPATGAAYAETPEQQAARETLIANYQPRAATGFAEMILVFTQDDRDETGRLVAACREVLGADLKSSEVVLRALRTLSAVLDARHDNAPILMGRLAHHAGWAAGE